MAISLKAGVTIVLIVAIGLYFYPSEEVADDSLLRSLSYHNLNSEKVKNGLTAAGR